MMYTVLILLTGGLLVTFSKPKDKQSYYKSVLAIFGIAYFVIWRFLVYFSNIAEWIEAKKQVVFFVLVVVMISLSLTKWIRHITPIPANSFAAVFFICIIATFTLENNIKNFIAEKGGFFDSDYSFGISDTQQDNSTIYNSTEGGFSISIPETWQQREHRSGLIQLVRHENKQHAVILSPTCFHNADISLLEIINNIKNFSPNSIVHHKCFISDQGYYSCFVRSQSDKQTIASEKWQWFVTDKWQKQSIELNFVFYTESQQTRQEAGFIIQSLAITPLTSPLPNCVNSLNWD